MRKGQRISTGQTEKYGCNDCASNQDSLLWAHKLPGLGTGRLELAARGHSNSGNVDGTFQIYVENTFISTA